ncbi:MAG TPA: LPXTG cell wall anchor domain-containing protein [Mobilitalea sp.]|nr:LPXTG cell wall anchor domain-containing protein [Mobilitalea sp.]
MNWANNGTDMYIDNVKLLDKDGNAIPFVAADAAAPSASSDNAVPKTGETSYAGYYIIGAVVMLAGTVFVLKKRKSVEA